MQEKFPQELPQGLIDKALEHYSTSESASNAEKREINKFQYVQKNGETKLETEHTESAITVHLTINSKTYTTEIATTLSEPIEIDEMSFTDTKLLAVCLQEGFPWAKESYVAYYSATVENIEETRLDPPIFIELCTPPREPEYTAEIMENPQYFELDKLLPMMKPNPWEFGSITVVYEDTDLAEKFLPIEEGTEIKPSMATNSYR